MVAVMARVVPPPRQPVRSIPPRSEQLVHQPLDRDVTEKGDEIAVLQDMPVVPVAVRVDGVENDPVAMTSPIPVPVMPMSMASATEELVPQVMDEPVHDPLPVPMRVAHAMAVEDAAVPLDGWAMTYDRPPVADHGGPVAHDGWPVANNRPPVAHARWPVTHARGVPPRPVARSVTTVSVTLAVVLARLLADPLSHIRSLGDSPIASPCLRRQRVGNGDHEHNRGGEQCEPSHLFASLAKGQTSFF